MDFDDIFHEPEDIEAYCVRCRQTITMEDPMPVWTRKGMPATRGECPTCGGAVFRMGKTEAHGALNRPAAVQVAERSRAKLSQDTVYVACAAEDMAFAEQLADDLTKAGIANWVHGSEGEGVQWAGGVHPALRECLQMVLILSPNASEESVTQAWKFFKEKRKPVVIAQMSSTQPPDDLRRSPRFDFGVDYKTAFRQMIQALSVR